MKNFEKPNPEDTFVSDIKESVLSTYSAKNWPDSEKDIYNTDKESNILNEIAERRQLLSTGEEEFRRDVHALDELKLYYESVEPIKEYLPKFKGNMEAFKIEDIDILNELVLDFLKSFWDMRYDDDEMDGFSFINIIRENPTFFELSNNEKTSFLRKSLNHVQFFMAGREIYQNEEFFGGNKRSWDYEYDILEKDERNFEEYNEEENERIQKVAFKTTTELSEALEQARKNEDWERVEILEEYFDFEAYDDFRFESLTREILKESKKYFKDRDDIDFVIDFWQKNRNPLFVASVSEVLSENDPNYSAQKLLELLRSEKRDKNYISSVLHRLEFGRIGISEEGVEYLEKMYDLGEYNNPDYHVSRLTANGEIGVFDENLELIKYFQLGELDSDEKKVRAKVMDFVYETLFIAKENESEEEKQKRLKYLKEFKKNYYDLSQDELFKETGVRLNNLDFREQGWFLKYLNEADESRRNKMKNLTQDFGEEGMKTFLALELGDESGQIILNLTEKLERPIAEAVFAKFNEITALIKESREEISKKYFDKNMEFDPSAEIVKRAQKILLDFNSQIELLDYPNVDQVQKKEAENQIFDKLKNINNEALFFGAIFRSAFEQGGDIKFEDLKNVNFENIPAPDLLNQKPEYVNAMKKVEEKNYPICSIDQDSKTDPDCYTAEFRQAQFAGFENTMSNPRVKIYNLSKIENNQEEPIAFMAIENFDFDKESKKPIKKFSTFNVNSAYRGSKLGEAMMSRCLDFEAVDSIIRANCSPKALIAQKYIEAGFVATRIFEYKGEDGFDIIRDDNKNSNYKSKTLSQENLISYQGSDFEIQKTDKGNLPDFSKLDSGYVLTRYFTKGRHVYTVFEVEK